jgi:hypothetical protein
MAMEERERPEAGGRDGFFRWGVIHPDEEVDPKQAALN